MKVFIASIIFCLISCVATIPEAQLSATRVENIEGVEKDELYERTLFCLTKRIVDSRTALEYKSKEKGRMVANIIFSYDPTVDIKITFQIDIQNNKVKIKPIAYLSRTSSFVSQNAIEWKSSPKAQSQRARDIADRFISSLLQELHQEESL